MARTPIEMMEMKIPVVAEIVLPVNVFPTLIQAMQDQYDRYMKIHGKTKENETKETK